MRSKRKEQAEIITLHSLDRQQGQEKNDLVAGMSGIPGWLYSVYDLPLEDWTAADLARACRQEVQVEALMPYCLIALRAHPRQYGHYNPELLEALLGISLSYWREHPQQEQILQSILTDILRHPLLDNELSGLREQVQARIR